MPASLRSLATHRADATLQPPREDPQDEGGTNTSHRAEGKERLARKLADVSHLLDGLLEPLEALEGLWIRTHSVLELIALLQDHHFMQMVKWESGWRLTIETKMKRMLMQKLGRREVPGAGAETFDVALAVLVYFLSSHAETEGWFDDKVLLDAVVYALRRAVTRARAIEVKQQVKQDEKLEVDTFSSTSAATFAVEKKCLKRKQKFKMPNDAASAKVAGARAFAGAKSVVSLTHVTSTDRDESCWMQLDGLLRDHESFYVEGKLHVSVVSALSAALQNLLQVSETLPSLSLGLTPQLCDVSSRDSAENTCDRIRARKRQLVRNGGVDVLMRELGKRVHDLIAVSPLTRIGAITLDCIKPLQRIKTLLCFFDQISFLALNVQRYIARKRALVALLLKLIRLLSELSWGTHAQGWWKAEVARMSLAVETLLCALRVLINLTHCNVEAAQHVFALDGMPQLTASLFQLLSFVMRAKEHLLLLSAARKWEFDACLLLLSLMVNCIEFSKDNRDALAGVSLLQRESTRGACGLFVSFFLAKVQSFQHLISEPKDANEAVRIDDDSDDWNPEDVILGGCMSLLLGYLIEGSVVDRALILSSLPGFSPRLLLRALSAFVALHSQIGALTFDVATSVLHVEKVLKSCQEGLRDAYYLTDAAEASPEVFERQCASSMGLLDSGSVVGSDIAVGSSLGSEIVMKESVMLRSGDESSSSLQAGVVKGARFRLDDSDGEYEPRRQGQMSNLDVSSAFEIHDTPPMTPCGGKRPYSGLVETSYPSSSNTRSPLRPSISLPTAVLPDDSPSSPVVTRLLKRTREIVREFDAEFTKPDCSTAEKQIACSEITTARSPCMVLTMNLTCRENESDGLDISPDVLGGSYDSVGMNMNKIIVERDVCGKAASMRKKKSSRDFNGPAENAVFEFASTDTTLSTSSRVQKCTMLLQTPTNGGHSFDFDRPSPSLNLTPTKTTPSTSLQFKTSQKLLRKSCRSSLNQQPLSANSLRRKAKAVRTASSSIFDFADSDRNLLMTNIELKVHHDEQSYQ
uniref:Wings apart-like protein C-terminal domain-containing protein n=1 Tax=Peronospora matthiolae TaxID=2874970 RepID=A0AAV1TMA8_9STRA